MKLMFRPTVLALGSLLLMAVSPAAMAKKTAPVPMPYPSWRLQSKVGKANVCSITINSSEEIEMFKKKLGDKNFNYIELTTLQDDIDLEVDENKEQDSAATEEVVEEKTWLKRACEKKITCDILVVSGHFGGTFFGSSGLSLSMEELETASCDQSCDGVLQNPKEVFLFGCNTLAGKVQDHRSPEEYRRVLIEDGFTHEQAEQVVAFRYSPLGDSFFDRMRRVFRGTPRIYGFDSVGPSGKNVENLLSNYFSQQGAQYYLLENLSKIDESTNVNLKKALEVTALAQTAGAKEITREQVPVCYLNNPKVPFAHKLNWIEKSLNSEKSFAYLPAINEWLSALTARGYKWREHESEVFEKVMRNHKLRDSLSAIVKRSDSAIMGMQLKILSFMRFMGWILARDYNNKLEELLIGDIKTDFDVARKDQICSYASANSLKVSFDVDSIPAARFQDAEFISVLKCMAGYSDGLITKAFEGIKTTNADLLKAYTEFLIEVKVPDTANNHFFNLLFPNGDRALTQTEKYIMCGNYNPRRMKLDQLNPKFINDPAYIETVGCYATFNSKTLDQLINLSSRVDLVDSVIKTIGHAKVGDIKVELSAQTQIKFYKFLRDVWSFKGYGVEDYFGMMTDIKPELKNTVLQDQNVFAFTLFDKKEAFVEKAAIKVLSADEYCSKVGIRAEEMFNRGAKRAALGVLSIAVDACSLPETYKLRPDFAAKYASLIERIIDTKEKVVEETATPENLETIYYYSLLEHVLDPVKVEIKNLNQMKNMIRMNQETYRSYGNVLGDADIMSMISREDAIREVKVALADPEFYKNEAAMLILSQMDLEDQKIVNMLAEILETMDESNAYSVRDALATQDSEFAARVWLSKFEKAVISGAELYTVPTYGTLFGSTEPLRKKLIPELLNRSDRHPKLMESLLTVLAETVFGADYEPTRDYLRTLAKQYPELKDLVIMAIRKVHEAEQNCMDFPRACMTEYGAY